jgi:transcriptional antiterminator RfaH
VVHFGCFWPIVPDQTIEELQNLVGSEGIRVLDPAITVGEEVEVATGAFEGFRGIVTRVMPAKDRVAVLLDFLGRQTTVELPMNGVLKDSIHGMATMLEGAFTS